MHSRAKNVASSNLSAMTPVTVFIFISIFHASARGNSCGILNEFKLVDSPKKSQSLPKLAPCLFFSSANLKTVFESSHGVGKSIKLLPRSYYEHIFITHLLHFEVHGAWSGWSVTESCTQGRIGYRSRERTCNNPEPVNGGRQCYGQAAGQQPCYKPTGVAGFYLLRKSITLATQC